MLRIKAVLLAMVREETGATMAEYAMMAALVAGVCVVAVTAFGTAVSAQFTAMTGGF